MIEHPNKTQRLTKRQQRADENAKRYLDELQARQQRIDAVLAAHLASGASCPAKVTITSDNPGLRDSLVGAYEDQGWTVTHTTRILPSYPPQYESTLTFA